MLLLTPRAGMYGCLLEALLDRAWHGGARHAMERLALRYATSMIVLAPAVKDRLLKA